MEKALKLLEANKYEDALRALKEYVQNRQLGKVEEDIDVQLMRIRQLQRSYDGGTISFDTYMSQTMRFRQGINLIIDDIRLYEDLNEDPNKGEKVEANKMRRILFLGSNPFPQAKLQLEVEYVRILTALRDFDHSFDPIAEWAITLDDLQIKVLQNKPSIFHFSGHGNSGKDNDKDIESGIFVRNASGRPEHISAKALDHFFKVITKKVDIEVVVMNSCYSAEQAQAIGKHVPYVIGMTNKIRDDVAQAFSTGFYRGLAAEGDVEFAFELAENRILIENLPDGAEPQIVINKELIEARK